MAGRENHRERLVEGALICLHQRGYARTTARDIAAAADANLGSIGYHFGSKDALLTEALNQGFRDWTDHIVAQVLESEATTPLERLRVSWATMMDSFEEQRALLLAFVEALAPAARSPDLSRQLAELYEEMREGIGLLVAASLGEEEGEPSPTARTLASLLIAVCDGLVIQWLLDPERTPTGDEMVDAVETALESPELRTALSARPP
jgi:AcrR family transcriptional regulator